MGYRVLLEKQGAKWYHTDDHYSPNLSKKSLGEFFYTVLKTGADIGNIFVLNNKYDRSFIGVSVFMTLDMKTQIEKNTLFKFKDPPKVSLN